MFDNPVELLAGGFLSLIFVYVGARLATHAYFRSKLDYFRTTSKSATLRGEHDAQEL